LEAATAPARSLAQRRAALKEANRIRLARAQLKRDLKAGREDVVVHLLNPPDWLLTAKVFDVLLALPGLGRVKVNRILSWSHVSPSKTVGGLTDRQRDAVVRWVRR
jgi:hypothetical protein